jgi:hypothetical protein
MLRPPTVSQPVFLGVKSHLGPKTTFLLLSGQLDGLLIRGAISNDRLGLSFTISGGLASVVGLGSESRGTRDYILLSQIRDYHNQEGKVPVFISLGTRWPRYTIFIFERRRFIFCQIYIS